MFSSLQVFRIYDNRFRESSRSATVYRSWQPLSSDTVDILDWDSPNKLENIDSIKGFREPPLGKSLQLISTPYREGRHFATRPLDFLPIIDQLKDLHAAGFVHGDIRAYNMVFGERDESNVPKGWLIDFDFGGEVGKVFYPPGYKEALKDGTRMGKEGQPIEMWHDWSALGNIIFHMHFYDQPIDSTLRLELVEHDKLDKTWTSVRKKWARLGPTNVVKDENVEELIALLQKSEELNWTVGLENYFASDLKQEWVKHGTCPKATGSPPQVNLRRALSVP